MDGRPHPRDAQAPYLSDKGAAEPEQFEADGFGQLRDAITRSGGIDRWLTEFGLPEPHHHRGRRRMERGAD